MTQSAPRTRRGVSGGSVSLADLLFRGSARIAAWLVLALVLGIGLRLALGSAPALARFGPGFLASAEWNAVSERFGALVPLVGTLVTSTLAMLIAVPASFGIAIFVTELAPPLVRRPVAMAIELLAAIPSIIYGMWGLFAFAPFFADHLQPWLTEHLGELPLAGRLFQGPPMGIGVFTASLILSIMVIPFVSSVMRDVFEVVPHELKESAYAMGATTWEVLRHVVFPYTRVGVMGGILLGLGRALGETMAVTFVIGNAHRLSASLFMPGNTISSALANEFTEAVGEMYTSSLVALGLVLFGLTFVVLAMARLLLYRIGRQSGTGRA